MMIVRVFAAIAKPALVTGAISATVAGGWFAFDRYGPDGNVSAFRAVQDDGQRLLISEFGQDGDTLVAIDPHDVTTRSEIATIDHAEGFGIFATLSPDEQAVAYTAIPADVPEPSPDTPAHAAIVDLDGNVTVLAADIDLLIAPIWSPDSESIVVRKNTPQDDDNGSFELLLLARDGTRTVITTWNSAAVFPIGFSPDGATLYFATLNQDGTDVYRIAPDGSVETLIAHLSDQIARDWRISPDGETLAYSVAESGGTPSVVAKMLDLATGVISDAIPSEDLAAGPPSTGVARGEFNPAWRPDGALSVGAMNLDGGANAVSVDGSDVVALTRNDGMLDLPLDWAPDGASLALRAVEGPTPFEAGVSYVEIVRDGERERVSDSADVLIVGWLE